MSQSDFQRQPGEAHHNHHPQPRPQDEKFGLILARFHQSEHDRIEQATGTLRDVLLPQFRKLRVANIEAAYSGSGDLGAIDAVQYRDSAGQRVDRSSIPVTLIENLETCLYEFLPAGFESNNGSQGTLTVDTHMAKVTIQHHENSTATGDSIREFTL